MTKRLLVSILLLLSIMNSTYSQSDHENYVLLRNKGQELMKQGKYSNAYQSFDGAEEFAKSSKDKTELSNLQMQLKKSVQDTYNQGITLVQNAKNNNDYSVAIQELRKLIPTEGLDVPLIYSWLGTAYERIGEPYSAIEQYELGVKHKEHYSAYRLAELLQTHKSTSVSNDSIIKLYEFAAVQNDEAKKKLRDMQKPSNAVDKNQIEKTNSNPYLSTTSTNPYNYLNSSISGKKGKGIDVDEKTLGYSYGFSKHFQTILAGNYTISYLSIGCELGINYDKNNIVRSDVETDDPIFFLTASPGFYYKYFSINCGIGFLFAQNKTNWTKPKGINIDISSDDVTVSPITYEQDSTKKPKIGFLIKPLLKGYIPIREDEFYITIDAGYIYIPNFRDFNGFTFGAGIQMTL